MDFVFDVILSIKLSETDYIIEFASFCKIFNNNRCFDVPLEKYSVYEVKVSASTKVGEGQNTTAKEFRTGEDGELHCSCYLLIQLFFVKINY